MRNSLILLIISLFSCTAKKALQKKEPFFSIPKYIQHEIKRLDSLQIGLTKTIADNDIPGAHEETDTANWKKELTLFLDYDINDLNYENKIETQIDTNNNLKITTFYCNDSSLEIQKISVTEINNIIQLIEINTNLKSFTVDRKQRLSYMPNKGFNMHIEEDLLWKSPSKKEIQVEIKNPDFLR